MGKSMSGQDPESAYNYRNFNILCENCEVGGQQKSDILEFFLYDRPPEDGALLKHFAALSVFYTNIFLTKDTYNGKADAVRVILNNCRAKGLRTIIDPGCHIRSRAEKFMREYKNNRAVLIETKSTNKLDMANMVRVEDYGLKFACRRGVFLIQPALATEFVYSAKNSYTDFISASEEEPVKPSIIKAVTTGFQKRPEQRLPPVQPAPSGKPAESPAPAKPEPEARDDRRAMQFPIEALKKLIDILARQGLTSSARMVKILVNNYGVIVNELMRAKNKREWLDEHYYIYTLLDNSAEGAYKQLENAANACDDVIRRYEALKSLSVCKPAFINVWNACLRALEQNGIRVLPVKCGGAVSKSDLKEGWELRNTEGRKADGENPVNKVYGIIQNGVLAESEIARRPILNVYTD